MISTLAKEGLSSNPFFLTKSIIEAGVAIAAIFILMASTIYFIGKLFGGNGDLKTIVKLWVFSLLPTLSWFLIATIFYVLIPPPRTVSLQGQLFSVLFLTFSIACFYWKGILYYLTLRIGHHLNSPKIALATLIIIPMSIIYSITFYKLGVFRTPFI